MFFHLAIFCLILTFFDQILSVILDSDRNTAIIPLLGICFLLLSFSALIFLLARMVMLTLNAMECGIYADDIQNFMKIVERYDELRPLITKVLRLGFSIVKSIIFIYLFIFSWILWLIVELL
jgi:hypothetical protein